MGVVTAVSKVDLAIIATLTTTLAARTSAAASSGRATHGLARPATTKKPIKKNPSGEVLVDVDVQSFGQFTFY